MTDQGKELGVVSDLIVEPNSKETSGLEISSGAINDFVAGRDEVPLEQIENIGSELLVIKNKEEGEHEMSSLQ
jgi:sporulation protein YlmC with PRC-barrel domain